MKNSNIRYNPTHKERYFRVYDTRRSTLQESQVLQGKMYLVNNPLLLSLCKWQKYHKTLVLRLSKCFNPTTLEMGKWVHTTSMDCWLKQLHCVSSTSLTIWHHLLPIINYLGSRLGTKDKKKKKKKTYSKSLLQSSLSQSPLFSGIVLNKNFGQWNKDLLHELTKNETLSRNSPANSYHFLVAVPLLLYCIIASL